MTSCELCGRDEPTNLTLVEGVELNVCEKCASFGKPVKRRLVARAETSKIERKPLPEKEMVQTIREDYFELIRIKREKMGLTQKDFSKFLSEKESVIHKIESGLYVPPIDLARKIEKQLGLSLIEEKEVTPQHIKAKKETFTIGDVIKVK
jgi:putative transcription factor